MFTEKCNYVNNIVHGPQAIKIPPYTCNEILFKLYNPTIYTL